MTTVKSLLLVLALGILGCTASPTIPVLTSDHPASAEGAQGQVSVMAIPLTNNSIEKTPAKHSADNKEVDHDRDRVKGMSGMNTGDK